MSRPNSKLLLPLVRDAARVHGAKTKLSDALGYTRQTIHNKLKYEDGFTDEELRRAWAAIGDPSAHVDADQDAGNDEEYLSGMEIEGFPVVPRYDLALAAGHGNFVERAPLLDHIPFTEAFLRRKLGRSSTNGLVMLDARGDSMEPTIEDGDLVMVDTLDTHLRDGLMAYVLEDVAFIKRMRPLVEGGVEIISDNRDVYEPQRLGRERLPEMQIIGRIRWIGKVV